GPIHVREARPALSPEGGPASRRAPRFPRCLAASGRGGYKALLAPAFRLQPQVGRSVAQPGSALASGARGREFESPRSDQHLAKTGTTYARDNARETQRVDCARRYEDMASTDLFLPPRPSCDRPLLAGHRRDVAGGAVLEVRPMMAVDLLQS